MTAAQALSHPWIQNHNDVKVPLDILIFRLMKAYIRSSTLRKAALKVCMLLGKNSLLLVLSTYATM